MVQCDVSLLNREEDLKMFHELKFRIIERYGTQAAFAAACGRNDGWISRLICGRQKPTSEDLILIAQKLGVGDLEVSE